jgi:hypothetical protein
MPAARLPRPRPAPHNRAARDRAPPLAGAESDDLGILHIIRVAAVAAGAGPAAKQTQADASDEAEASSAAPIAAEARTRFIISLPSTLQKTSMPERELGSFFGSSELPAVDIRIRPWISWIFDDHADGFIYDLVTHDLKPVNRCSRLGFVKRYEV